MAKEAILVDLGRCVGCWTCAMACKAAHHLDVDEYRVSVRTIGGGGIDEPAGTFPDLHMRWMPVYSKSCTLCGDRLAEGERPYCEQACPTDALVHGDIEDPESEISKKRAELIGRGRREERLPEWENSLEQVIYLNEVG